MAGLDTLPDEDLKGNEESNNTAQEHADNLYKTAPDSEADADRAELARMERGEDAGEGDRSLADATPEERREALARQEAGGSPPDPAAAQSLYSADSGGDKSTFAARLLAGSKRFGPSGGVIGLIVAGFGMVSVIAAPGSILVAMEKAITNDSSDSTRTNVSFRRAYVAKLFKSNGEEKSGSAIEDKLTSMSEDQKARWEDAGFKVNLDPNGKIESMEFPDGAKVQNAADFTDHAENTPTGREAVADVVDSRSAFFDNEEFKSLVERFGTEKGDRLDGSNAETEKERTDAVDKSFDEKIDTGEKAGDDTTARETKLTEETTGENNTALQDRIDKIAGTDNVKDYAGKLGKAGLAGVPVSAACTIYNAAKLTNTVIKTKWIYDLVSFAYPFVRAAAQIEDQGDIEPEVVDDMASRLTWYNPDSSKPDYNKTALDSQGLQMAIYGDLSGLTKFSKQYTAWGWETSIDSVANNYVSAANTLLGGKNNVKNACVGAHDLQTVASAACLAGAQDLAVCAILAVAEPAIESIVLPIAISALAQPALKFLATVDLSSALKGEGAGDAIAAGVGLLLTGQSMGSGLMPVGGKNPTSLIYKFIANTNDTYYNHTTQLALDEAKKNQFDVSNQYSFMGQLVGQINPYLSGDGTLFSKLANLTTVVNSSFSKLPTTASAMFSQPSNMTLTNDISNDPASNRIAKCQDPDMADIGAACDWSGRMIGYTSDPVLQGLNQIANGSASGGSDKLTKSINYMVQNKDIDPTNGETIPNSDFKQYRDNCVDRLNQGGSAKPGGYIPIGSSVASFNADNYNWTDGSRCMPHGHGSTDGSDKANNSDPDMLDAFATYYNWCYIQYATAERMTDCVHNTPESGGAASTSCGDGTTASIYTCALQFDNYTYVYGAGHDTYGTTSWYITFKDNPPEPPANPFDCSSLVMASLVAAFGKDVGGISAPGGFQNSPNWKKVDDASGKGGQQGDVIVWNGHVEIIKADNGHGYDTFGAHSANADPTTDIGPYAYNYKAPSGGDAYVGVYRYQGAK